MVCSGDPADGGVVGVWHFEKVVNARDGSELMGPDEIAPLRAARQKQLLQRAEAADAAVAKVEAKKLTLTLTLTPTLTLALTLP